MTTTHPLPGLSRPLFILLAALIALSTGPIPVHAAMPQPVLDEIARLNAVADGQPENFQNPHPRHDSFLTWPAFDGGDWKYLLIDGSNGDVAVNGPTFFDNSSAEVTGDRILKLTQVYDDDFDSEYPYQYNNVAMIGMQGYMPTDSKHIVWTFKMRIEAGFFGTAGFVVEPEDTFTGGGTFALPFDMFGVAYIGDQSSIAGLSCVNVISWVILDAAPITAVDPFQWNDYEIDFYLLDAHDVTAIVYANGDQACQMTIPNYSLTEIQVWSDNQAILIDPGDPDNYTIEYINSETPQSIYLDDIAVKAHP
jgi:hypothetical protein